MLLSLALVALVCINVNAQEDFGNKTTLGYNAGELLSKIFSGNATQLRRLVKFENQFDSNHVTFDNQNSEVTGTRPFTFGIGQQINPNTEINDGGDNTGGDNLIKFNNGQKYDENEPNNALNNGLPSGNGKRKRRRRKPKQQPGRPGFPIPGYPGPIGPPPDFNQGFGYGPGSQNLGPNGFQPELNGQFYRPPRRPQSSLASETLSAVTGALTSIAHNDDYQCVARLLCEAAAGGALGGSSLLDSVSGLQPLLTLLSAYNGISSNPLFVFGRAAFLGMSSKGNSGSCRYAYPLCPTDPEQLVHYLNNHNGGFFRFFNAPQQGPQNLQQFYNQLSQNQGPYQPNPESNQEYYGLLNPGLYQHPPQQPNLYTNDYGNQQNYGFAYPYNQNYNNGNGIRFKNADELVDQSKLRININGNRIEKRIQNKPASFVNDNYVESNSKWLFPGEDDDDRDESKVGVQYVNNDFSFEDGKGKVLKFPETDNNYNSESILEHNNRPINLYTTEAVNYINSDDFRTTDSRKGKALKFPEAHNNYEYDNSKDYNNNFYPKETIRKPKGISFAENPNNIRYYNTNNYYNTVYPNGVNYPYNKMDERNYDNFKGASFNSNKYNDYEEEPGVTTVYVVRGNGDPSKPEIVKLRPGQTL